MATKDSSLENVRKSPKEGMLELSAVVKSQAHQSRPQYHSLDKNQNWNQDIRENERPAFESKGTKDSRFENVITRNSRTEYAVQQNQKEIHPKTDESTPVVTSVKEERCKDIGPQLSRLEEHKRYVGELKVLQREMNGWYNARHEATIEGKGSLAARTEELEATIDEDKKMEAVLRCEIANLKSELHGLRDSETLLRLQTNEQHRLLQRLREDSHRVESRQAIVIAELKKNMSDVQEKGKAELSSEASRWAAIVSDLEEHIRKVEAEQQSQHQRLRSELEQEHQVDRQQLESVIDALKREHQAELQSYESKFLSEISQLGFEKDRQIVILQSKLSAKSNEFAVLSAMIKTQRNDESRNLREKFQKEIDGYRVALMARDNFTPLTDMEITSKFQDLAYEIERLARMDWKAYPDLDIVLLRSLAANTRFLQKQLLQHVIWSALYYFLLASPFRMFGAEGKTLEKGWSHISKTDSDEIYLWPPASIENERWRYINVKECRSALIQPAASQSDPRMKLKEGYSTTIDNLKQHLYETLECTIGLDENEKQSIAKISKKASKMWLDFGMERCRFLVVMKDVKLETVQDQLRRAQAGEPLELTPCPQLRRYGDSMGQDLEVHSAVHGCEGSTVTVVKMERSQ